MRAVAVILVLLAVPLGHQVYGHRLGRPGRPATRHELAHRARSRPLRLAADALWLAYLAGVLAVAVALR